MPLLNDLNRMRRAAGPLLYNALRSGQLFKPQCTLTEPIADVLSEFDVHIPLSDGTHVTANVFRSRSRAARGERMPAVMCAHPYDNHLIPALGNTPFNGPPQQYRMIPQADKPAFSTLTSWESPDPNFWVDAGYAVVNMNMPGYANSGGKPSLFSPAQTRAFGEAIDWIGQREWCTGDIGLTGVSYLAISQYGVASTQRPEGVPACLRAISPWEGITSFYQDLFMEGGIEEQGFPTFWWYTEVKPTINCSVDEFVEIEGQLPHRMTETHPFYDEYWKAKEPDLASIELPMLICASFSDQGLHTRGTFRAYMEARSPNKWLYTHRWLKWDAYYSQEVLQLTRSFFDRFVKGEQNGFEARAPVRLEVRASRDEIHAVRDEPTWPLPDTDYRRLYLHDRKPLLTSEPAAAAGEHTYDARRGKLHMRYTFDTPTELTGYMTVRLWVEARGAPPPRDMAIFVGIDKLDVQGAPVRFFGPVGNHNDLVARGLLRVARRALDPAKSTEFQPVLLNQNDQPLQPGEVVPIEIAIQPSSTYFDEGESLELIIAANVIVPSYPFIKATHGNAGVHVIHSGGDYDSYLLIPVINR